MNFKTDNKITSKTINFYKENVLNITDLTRTNKLSEILNSYSVNESAEVYIIQNSKNKNAAAVITDLKHYERLLKMEEAFDKAMDEEIFKVSLERIDNEANIPLSEVLKESEITFDDLMQNLDNIKIDEEG